MGNIIKIVVDGHEFVSGGGGDDYVLNTNISGTTLTASIEDGYSKGIRYFNLASYFKGVKKYFSSGPYYTHSLGLGQASSNINNQTLGSITLDLSPYLETGNNSLKLYGYGLYVVENITPTFSSNVSITYSTPNQIKKAYEELVGTPSCVIVDNICYICGGSLANDSSLEPMKVTLFDLTTDTIIKTITLNGQRCKNYCNACYDNNGHIYIFGGTTSTEYNGGGSTEIFKYDISTEMLSKLTTTLPQPLQNGGTCYNNGYIYIFGGLNQSNVRNSIYKFDISTETISTLGITLPIALCNVFIKNNGTTAFLLGQSSDTSTLSNYVIFDFPTDTITSSGTTTGSAPQRRSAVFVYGTKIISYGGLSGTSPINACKLLDETTKEWTTLANQTCKLNGYPHNCVTYNNYVYIFNANYWNYNEPSCFVLKTLLSSFE